MKVGGGTNEISWEESVTGVFIGSPWQAEGHQRPVRSNFQCQEWRGTIAL